MDLGRPQKEYKSFLGQKSHPKLNGEVNGPGCDLVDNPNGSSKSDLSSSPRSRLLDKKDLLSEKIWVI